MLLYSRLRVKKAIREEPSLKQFARQLVFCNRIQPDATKLPKRTMTHATMLIQRLGVFRLFTSFRSIWTSSILISQRSPSPNVGVRSHHHNPQSYATTSTSPFRFCVSRPFKASFGSQRCIKADDPPLSPSRYVSRATLRELAIHAAQGSHLLVDWLYEGVQRLLNRCSLVSSFGAFISIKS